jgi:hypothetical protein
MTKIVAAALAGILVLAGTGIAEAKKSNTARNIAIGVGAAVATGIILNEAAKAESRSGPVRSYDAEEEHDRSCRRWMRKCDDGERWACKKFDNNC